MTGQNLQKSPKQPSYIIIGSRIAKNGDIKSYLSVGRSVFLSVSRKRWDIKSHSNVRISVYFSICLFVAKIWAFTKLLNPYKVFPFIRICLPRTLTHDPLPAYLKTVTFAITFEQLGVWYLYFICAFLVIRPLCSCHNFWPCNIALMLWTLTFICEYSTIKMKNILFDR